MPKQVSKTIITNKKAKFDYELTETFEAGLVLEGWEVKSLREGQVSLQESFVVIKDFEGWLHNDSISPLISKSTHYKSTPTRMRKLLLNTNEIKKIKVHIEQKGLTCVCLSMYWKGHLVKCQLALARGKSNLDKRRVLKERAWNIDKQRLLKSNKQ